MGAREDDAGSASNLIAVSKLRRINEESGNIRVLAKNFEYIRRENWIRVRLIF